MTTARPFLLQALLLALLPGVTLAQFEAATVLGTVKDGSGAVIIGSKVTLENTRTGVAFNTQSNDAGNFDFLAVQVGTYRLKAEATGFKTGISVEFKVDVSARQRVDLTLEVGNLTEAVAVKDNAALLETDSGDRGQIVNNATVRKLVFRCESFNLLNKTNFQAPNSTSSSSAFGTIRSAFPARVIQMALKLVF